MGIVLETNTYRILVNSRIDIVSEGTAGDTRARIYSRHMIDNNVDYDLDTDGVASICHGLEVGATASFGLDLIRDNLVVGPPFWASYMLCWS
jgi:hypothetical protein